MFEMLGRITKSRGGRGGCRDICHYSNFEEAERRSLNGKNRVFCERVNGIVRIKKVCPHYELSQALLDFVAAGEKRQDG